MHIRITATWVSAVSTICNFNVFPLWTISKNVFAIVMCLVKQTEEGQ